VSPLPPRERLLHSAAWVGAFAGLAWAGVQLVLTLVGVSTDAPACLRDLHKTALVICMSGTALAAVAVLALIVAGRPRGMFVALAAEATFAIAWMAAGGFDAADCAFDV
jgi:hypothetical protein